MSIRHRPKSNTRQTKNGNLSAARAKEIRSILRSITAIQILNSAARGEMRLDQICDRLRVDPVHAETLSRTIRRMRNIGWLKTKKVASGSSHAERVHLITPQGRRALRALVSTFKDLFSWAAK